MPFYLKKKHREYQAHIRKLCIEEKITPIEGDVSVTIRWYRKRKQGDVPDRWKDLCDALQTGKRFKFGAYKDDSQIAEFYVKRLDTEPKESRVVVNIRKMEE
jgi:Holliday junction resolvase RusA-like endonuclease